MTGSRWGSRLSLVWDWPRAVWNLSCLLIATRGRWRGAYWRWRQETAFGRDARRPSAAVRRRAMLRYGVWVGRMRALARSRRT